MNVRWEDLYEQARQASHQRRAANPMASAFLSSLIKGAHLALRSVALFGFVAEIAVIVQMLERFISDRERELERESAPTSFTPAEQGG